jgi:hypothetical protein
LLRDGWVVFEGNTRVFYGPDVEVLRSTGFAQTHCFSLTAGQGADSSLVGLVFEPTRDRGLPDIGGTLWIHRESAELTRLDFRYANLPRSVNDPPDWAEGHLGGRVEFLSLPGGGWIARNWEIRTPLVGWVELFDERRELRLVGIQQTGGQVVQALSGGTVLYAADLATLTAPLLTRQGTSRSRVPRLPLAGTPFSTPTDAAGRFTISGTMDGEYGVTFHHPRLDSLAYTPAPVTVLLRPGRSETVRLRVPPESVIVRELCPDTGAGPPTRVVHGTVRERRGGAAPAGAEVRMSWQEIPGLAPTDPIAVQGRLKELTLREMEAVAPADSSGRYLMCAVPAGRRIAIAASRGTALGETVILRFEADGVWIGDRWTGAGMIWRQDLVHGAALPAATVVAVVTDAMTRRPLAHAIVTVVGTGEAVVADQSGRATIARVAPGNRVVSARRIGYAPVERVVRITPGDTVVLADSLLALQPMPFLLDTLVAAGDVAAAADPILRMGGFCDRRRLGFGDFITRQEFEQYNPVDVFDVLRRLPGIEILFNENYGRPAPDKVAGRDTGGGSFGHGAWDGTARYSFSWTAPRSGPPNELTSTTYWVYTRSLRSSSMAVRVGRPSNST